MSVDWDGGPGGARGPFGNRDSEFAMGVRGAREAEPPGERRAEGPMSADWRRGSGTPRAALAE